MLYRECVYLIGAQGGSRYKQQSKRNAYIAFGKDVKQEATRQSSR